MKIILEKGPEFAFLLKAETGDSRLVKLDSEFPGVARSFGWQCPTEDSRDSIWDAYEFPEENVGADIEDPGASDYLPMPQDLPPASLEGGTLHVGNQETGRPGREPVFPGRAA